MENTLKVLFKLFALFSTEVVRVIRDVNPWVGDVGRTPHLRLEEGFQQGILRKFLLGLLSLPCRLVHGWQLAVVDVVHTDLALSVSARVLGDSTAAAFLLLRVFLGLRHT